ncbi:hypothetical protein NP233_g12775 [Leucocoprinus birnbaumii]|uniref:Uncharacterized protein n=1 Tax=Leucocoprinus birnbaumii TaxID=56174 RepID=A0AAD5YPQ3_9AGAR|nr:hypothetical protein NP233_g12775 [Leucocoprinus birnbaumii]
MNHSSISPQRGSVLGKCYGNAMLVTLNNRHFLQIDDQLDTASGIAANSAFQPIHGQSIGGRLGTDKDGYSNTRSKAGVGIPTFKATFAAESESIELDMYQVSALLPTLSVSRLKIKLFKASAEKR